MAATDTDVVAYLIERGKEYLTVGNTVEADKCFKCAQLATDTALSLPSLSYSGVDVADVVQTFRLEQYLNQDALHAPQNKLECVTLLASGNEHSTGEYDQFVTRFVTSLKKSRKNTIVASSIHLQLVVAPAFNGNTKPLQELFKSFELVRLKIPIEFDFYETVVPKQATTHNLTFGYKAGPNWTFFEMMRQLKPYNTALLLECDCFFSSNWLQRIAQFVDASNGFWIAGALYGGLSYMPLSHFMAQHLNGGVALYATGNKNFQDFLKFSLAVFPSYLEKKPELPYDCFLASLLADFYNADLVNRPLWQFVRRQYTSTSLLQNYSPPQDKRVNEQRLFSLTNCAVLHKKTTPAAVTPVFIHLPRCGGTHFYLSRLLPNLQRHHLQEAFNCDALPFELTDADGKVLATVIAALKGYGRQANLQKSIRVPLEQFQEDVHQNKVVSILGFKLEEHAIYSRELKLVNKLCRNPAELIILLRDPLRQAESMFYWNRDVSDAEAVREQYKDMKFEDYLNSSFFVDNWLVRKITNTFEAAQLTEQHLNEAMQFVDRCAVVGFHHQYQKFLVKVCSRYGFVYSPMFYKQDKQAYKKNTVSKKVPITESLVRLFVAKSKLDDQLYNYCLSKYVSG